MAKKVKIFLCYAEEDKGEIKLLYNRLRREGFCPWLDIKEVSSEQNRRSEIKRAVETSRFFMACLSRNATTKRNALKKGFYDTLKILEKQKEGRAHFLPVLLEPCDIPKDVSHHTWGNIYTDEGFKKILYKIEKVEKRGFAPEERIKIVRGGAVGKPVSLSLCAFAGAVIFAFMTIPDFCPLTILHEAKHTISMKMNEGNLVQEGELIPDRFGTYEVLYPKAYGTVPELSFPDNTISSLKVMEQREDGFTFRVVDGADFNKTLTWKASGPPRAVKRS